MSAGDTSVKSSGYANRYAAALLHSVERAGARARLGIIGDLPFRGEDLWTGYEFSWLNDAGKPLVAGLRLRVPCTSPNLVESKSMKLYLNGFAQARFGSRGDVVAALENDLAAAFGAPLAVEVFEIGRLGGISRLPGESLDALDVAVHDYERNPELLTLADGSDAGQRGSDTGQRGSDPAQRGSDTGQRGSDPGQRDSDAGQDGADAGQGGADARQGGADTEQCGVADARVTATWHTDLFRSLCPITGQPDWASLMVGYTGLPVEPGGLLRYLVSFRRHAAFHEDTVERIFVDIMERCRPDELTVYGRFLRRGGLDINPFRSTIADAAPEVRLPRQ